MDTSMINITLQEIITENVPHSNNTKLRRLYQISYGLVIPTIIAFGLASNILNLITLNRPPMKKIPYLFIKARSITDLLVMIALIPFTIQNIAPDEEWNNYYIVFYFSKLQLLIVNSLLGSSSLYVTALTVERYLSICAPLTVLHTNRKRILIIIIVIPVITVLLHVPYSLSFDIEYDHDTSNVTRYTWKDDDRTNNAFYQVYLLALQALFRIGPTFFIASLNIRIIVEYRKVLHKRLNLRKTNSSDRIKEEERRLMFLLCGMSIMFFICNTPAAIVSVTVRNSLQKDYDFQIFRTISNLLEISNGALSFVTYLVSSRDFRKVAFSIKNFTSNRVGNVS